MSDPHRLWLVFRLLALVMLAAACTAAVSEPVTEGDPAHGRSLWVESSCVACHGVDARGNLQGPALANTPLSLRDVINITRRGTPGMPGYPPNQISDQALVDMYAWFQNPVLDVAREPEQSPWTRSGCGGCHGADAGGGTATPLTGQEPYDEFRRVVREGAEGMPAYSESQITDAELRWMYDWIQAHAQVPADPQDLWAQTGCSGCHGANAGGGTGPALASLEFPYPTFHQIVRQGTGGMPAYSESQISDAELQLLHDWLQVQVPAEPENLWAQTGCSGCHGLAAEGGTGPALAGEVPAYDEFRQIVREGADQMPAYSERQISDAELQRLHDWLQAQAAPPADPQDLWAGAGCGACHGASAEGASAVALAGMEAPYDEFERVVREGVEGMPGYSADRIGDEALQRMYEWLRAAP
jgi:mono/diheme cytochrome c family protein